MDNIFDDPAVLVEFSPKEQSDQQDLQVEVLDWFKDAAHVCPRVMKVVDLPSLDMPLVRVILAPLDHPRSAYSESILYLARLYSIPTAFLEESIRSVTHSFGTREDGGFTSTWFHYVCKDLRIVKNDSQWGYKIIPQSGHPALELQNADWTWSRSGFFLRYTAPEVTSRKPEVTLICFRAPPFLRRRLAQIPASTVCRSVARDPHCLFVIILNELSGEMDTNSWKVANVFRGIETDLLGPHHQRESFTGLHNVFKHIIFLFESTEAILLVLKSFSTHHQNLLDQAESTSAKARLATQHALVQVETSFQAVHLRLKSLEKRMQNVISLSYHMVTQEGTQIMQRDSSSMATIALVTLVFLPISTISADGFPGFLGVLDDFDSFDPRRGASVVPLDSPERFNPQYWPSQKTDFNSFL
ncbi:hypothetical protein N7492_010419 [Penicillium capsulatum]|uniref:Uncharacterized protein n=1 Tax=Penicillium capsulatum TaxID=69766 RepID=A0A9W9LEX1_9EURO|nr:hypothetical protein N7492_010419 [Penicillium capsulatum]KAJ6112923.1 hypothetical protein N7512_008247 [Penicillium capsulatum]